MSEPYTGELVELTACDTEFEAETIVQALRAQNIPAVSGGGALAGQWAAVGKVFVQVMVRTQDLDRATLALRAIRADSVDIDWEKVDTGDQSPDDDRPRGPRRAILWRFGLFVIGFWIVFNLLMWIAVHVFGLHAVRTSGTQAILFAAAFGFGASLALLTTRPSNANKSGDRP